MTTFPCRNPLCPESRHYTMNCPRAIRRSGPGPIRTSLTLFERFSYGKFREDTRAGEFRLRRTPVYIREARERARRSRAPHNEARVTFVTEVLRGGPRDAPAHRVLSRITAVPAIRLIALFTDVPRSSAVVFAVATAVHRNPSLGHSNSRFSREVAREFAWRDRHPLSRTRRMLRRSR